MADIQHLTDAMLDSAANVLARLVDLPVAASATMQHEREGSIKIDPERLVAHAQIPSLGIGIVASFASADVSKIVHIMLGGADDGSEMGAMQLSIVSETVSQIASAMAEELAKGVAASTDGVHADLCTDVTNLPPPPFASFEGAVQVGAELTLGIELDFDGIAMSVLVPPEPAPAAAPAAPKASRPQAPAPAAQSVSFASMTPTASRGQSGGSLDLVHDVPLQISAVLGKTALTLRDVVGLQSGSVFELDKLSTDPIDLYVNNILIARGEVVVVDDKFAVKIGELNPSVD